MIEKLKKVKLWVMFPDDVFNITEIGGFYDELDFEGSENLIELTMKIANHYFQLRTRPKDGWIETVHGILKKDTIHYFADINVLSECEFQKIKI